VCVCACMCVSLFAQWSSRRCLFAVRLEWRETKKEISAARSPFLLMLLLPSSFFLFYSCCFVVIVFLGLERSSATPLQRNDDTLHTHTNTHTLWR
jgi:NADH:ubiquinone oxidoreductase subunit 5 (subunit L)/multisubunit Na+/H+ antiporter MnhA subunit